MQLRFDSPDDAASASRAALFGAQKAEPPVFSSSRRLCCKRAHACCRARLTMTVLLPPVFSVIFIALLLAVLLELVQESTSDR